MVRVGETLNCEREVKNPQNLYEVGLRKYYTTVGHVLHVILGICMLFLNQARARFLKIDPVRIVDMHVCVCVYPRPRLLMTSGVIWRDMDLIRLVKQIL